MFIVEPHTRLPMHVIVPCWQGLPGGEHVAYGVQARHMPLPSHTPSGMLLVKHEAPAAAGAF
jgi:hypothetical protein